MADTDLDVATLRMLKTRKGHERFSHLVPADTVTPETRAIIKRMGQFFEATGADVVTFAEFWPFLQSLYPSWSEKQRTTWAALLRPVDGENPEGYNDTLMSNLLAENLASKALSYIEQWRLGEEIDLTEELRAAVEGFDQSVERRIRTPDVVLDWDQMIEEETTADGLKWRLEGINRSLRGLRGGDFGVIAMRPDRGKTSLIASEITFMAPQLVERYPDEFRPVVWFNNEGPGSRILGRIRQAALGMSALEIAELGTEAARAQYIELIGGREDQIMVKDIHAFTSWEVEELIRKLNPGLVVFDMIDNIKFAGETMNRGERTDQVLEAMYQWARVMCVKYNFPGLATSQISADGEGEKWPAQPLLKDSKTGKQGACDFILTGGYVADMPTTRFLGTTKNKLRVAGSDPVLRCPVHFDQDRCRLTMPEMSDL